ncbi:MAG: hypothetical protein KC619_13490 [Myxococcales bacterium]|nr:hypothetical protein [Myxococcales bacterium]
MGACATVAPTSASAQGKTAAGSLDRCRWALHIDETLPDPTDSSTAHRELRRLRSDRTSVLAVTDGFAHRFMVWVGPPDDRALAGLLNVRPGSPCRIELNATTPEPRRGNAVLALPEPTDPVPPAHAAMASFLETQLARRWPGVENPRVSFMGSHAVVDLVELRLLRADEGPPGTVRYSRVRLRTDAATNLLGEPELRADGEAYLCIALDCAAAPRWLPELGSSAEPRGGAGYRPRDVEAALRSVRGRPRP